MAWLFLVGYFLLGMLIALIGARSVRRWLRAASIAAATSLPALLWLGFAIESAVVFDRPLFDPNVESGKFGHYVGLIVVFWTTPAWLGGGLLGSWLGRPTTKFR